MTEDLRVPLLSNLHLGVLDTVPWESFVITICVLVDFFTPIVLFGFQWRTSDNMFSLYSIIFLNILLDFNHAFVWMLSVLPRIFRRFLFIRNIEEITGLAVTWSLGKISVITYSNNVQCPLNRSKNKRIETGWKKEDKFKLSRPLRSYAL